MVRALQKLAAAGVSTRDKRQCKSFQRLNPHLQARAEARRSRNSSLAVFIRRTYWQHSTRDL